MYPHSFRTIIAVALASGLTAAIGCTKPGNDRPSGDTTATAASAATPRSDSAAMVHGDSGLRAMSGMSGMTGDANHDFLRMMSDHHQGLIALVHPTVERQDVSPSVRADARKFDTAQDAELDTMMTMLEKTYKDPYTPKVMPENKAMNDSTLATSGPAFDRAFRAEVIRHHQMGIRRMDQYLPKLTDAKLKTMVQRMRADQTREIAELRQQLGKS